MQRRTAFATAGAITAVVMTAGIALANMGLFGLANADSGPGSARLVDTRRPALRPTQIVDVPVPATGTAQGSERDSDESLSDDDQDDDSYSSPATAPSYDDDHATEPEPEEHEVGDD